jgi:hypothetical protein
MDSNKAAQYYWEARVMGIALSVILMANAAEKIATNQTNSFGNLWGSYASLTIMSVFLIINVYQIYKYKPYQKAYGKDQR